MRTPERAVVVTGPPGAGKSTTGAELAAALGAALLDLDSVTNPLVDLVTEVVGPLGSDGGDVAGLVRRARYESLARVATDCLRAGVPVVLVAPFTEERQRREAWAALAERLRDAGGEPTLVWLRLTAQELGVRLVQRGAVRDQAKLGHLQGYLASVDLSPPRSAHLEVDASLPVSRQVAHLLRKLAG